MFKFKLNSVQLDLNFFASEICNILHYFCITNKISRFVIDLMLGYRGS